MNNNFFDSLKILLFAHFTNALILLLFIFLIGGIAIINQWIRRKIDRIMLRIKNAYNNFVYKRRYKKFNRRSSYNKYKLVRPTLKRSLYKHILGDETGVTELKFNLQSMSPLNEDLIKELLNISIKYDPKSDVFAQVMDIICDYWESRLGEHLKKNELCYCCRFKVPYERPRICPIPSCGHLFRGNGWDGIEKHWRMKHDDIITYETFWNDLCNEHRK